MTDSAADSHYLIGFDARNLPVRRADGKVVAAVAVSGPAFRLQSSDLVRVTRLTVEAGDAISRRLGHLARRRARGRSMRIPGAS